MKVYYVQYDGSYLGGHAVVLATSADRAIELVKNHDKTFNFKNATVEEVSSSVMRSSVLYNWAGEY